MLCVKGVEDLFELRVQGRVCNRVNELKGVGNQKGLGFQGFFMVEA